jgi:hypothetical protein
VSDTIFEEFPFEEIRNEGDYFDNAHQLRSLGYAQTQIWSIACGEDDELDDLDEGGDRWLYMTYGPAGHFINVIGYVATKEHHDNETYYQETIEMRPI